MEQQPAQQPPPGPRPPRPAQLANRQPSQRASRPARSSPPCFFSPTQARTPARPSTRGKIGPARQRLPWFPHPPFPSPLAVAMGTASKSARELAPLALALLSPSFRVPHVA